MFCRKLKALSYPEAEQFDHTDQRQLRSAALWLEEQKIRHYAAGDRGPLRDLQAEQWSEAFSRYLTDLSAPVSAADEAGSLDWLLGRAVRLAYGDNLKKYQSAQVNGTAGQPQTVKAPSQNPLDNLDFNSAEFVSGVERLARLLNLPCHPDHLVTLQAVSGLICQRLNKQALADPDLVVVKGTPFPLQDADLGFDTGDPVLNQAAKVLRLLHIRDLRALQTAINEALVAVQGLVADPRTDTRLGKVGK
ncbi:RNA transcription, translation and transport factor protein-like [Pollicipes pollicipes]|uniref:RNA transcription, translation and transport factor protein-like n=1 Tax=Pollicipes pollicipes TaxID=41117 RepID=UPI0018857CDC|nr:RNA transcription, translation and transport factor protein-like [Pollicipes pollicipes]